jgi:hypothetical protein
MFIVHLTSNLTITDIAANWNLGLGANRNLEPNLGGSATEASLVIEPFLTSNFKRVNIFCLVQLQIYILACLQVRHA